MLVLMPRRLLIVLGALVLASGCASSKGTGSGKGKAITAPSTTTSAAPTTTAPAPAETTTAPPAPTTTVPLTAAVASPTGVVLPVISADPAGALVSTPCSHQAVLTAWKPLGPVDVVLDPGHGGHEAGAIGPNGLAEKALNLAVAGYARDALARAGVNVVVDRTRDYDVTLTGRAKIALALKPKAFVSIHHNAEPDGPRNGPGTETYYQIASLESKRLAGLIYEEVVQALAQYQVAWVADTDAGTKYRKGSSGDDYYAMLRQTHGVTSALAELAYISDPAEADLLNRPDVQKVEGEAVARGIVRFLRTRDPGSGFVEPYPRTEPAGGGGGPQGCVDPPLT
jgi:N-acetylmuramoyl-L-alanine amidase